MASLVLVEGPAGSGKSGEVARRIRDGAVDVQADLPALHVALRAVERDPTSGRFPIRSDDDPAIRSGLAVYLRAAAVRQALRDDLNVVVTSGSPDTATRWADVADETGAAFSVKTIDPGEDEVRRRLALFGEEDSDELDEQCESAVQRWYGGRR